MVIVNIENFIKIRLKSLSQEKPVNTDWLYSLCKSYEFDITKQELKNIIIRFGYTVDRTNDLIPKSPLNSTLPKLFTTDMLTSIAAEDDIYSYTRKDNIELLEKI